MFPSRAGSAFRHYLIPRTHGGDAGVIVLEPQNSKRSRESVRASCILTAPVAVDDEQGRGRGGVEFPSSSSALLRRRRRGGEGDDAALGAERPVRG